MNQPCVCLTCKQTFISCVLEDDPETNSVTLADDVCQHCGSDEFECDGPPESDEPHWNPETRSFD